MKYDYQLVAFIDVDPEPSIGVFVYGDKSGGWLPNVAIKRRFGLNGIDETKLLEKIASFCNHHEPFGITFTRALKPDHMPESVIEVKRVPSLLNFHNDFIAYFGDEIQSKFPEREGDRYYPHMTTTWQGDKVVNLEDFLPKDGRVGTRHVDRVCLIKDFEGNNSQVLAYFDIRG